MKILTIVIPSYNTEAFIDKNISTFLDERLYECVEILIINDGSKDNTEKKAAVYEKKYPGYIRLISKDNGGHGSVINRGIVEAKGKYFKVVDADDWVNTENLTRLVDDLKKSDADVVVNSVVTVNQQTGHEEYSKCSKLLTLTPETSFATVLRLGFHPVLHSVTYKTSILRDNNITVTEKCFYEDFQYVLYPIPYIRTITVLDYPVYWYLIGQKTQSVDAANALKNADMYFKVFCDSVNYYEMHKNTYEKYVDKHIYDSICIFLRSLYNIYLRNSSEKDIVNSMKKMDMKVKEYSQEFYNAVGQRNAYIRWMRTGNKRIFNLLSIAYGLLR